MTNYPFRAVIGGFIKNIISFLLNSMIIKNRDIYFIYDIFNRQTINISHHIYPLV